MRGIVAGSVYVPRFRLESEELEAAWGTNHASGVEEKAVPAADEDALTMAIAAVRRVLADASLDRANLETVAVAMTTPPLDEGDVVPQLVRALDLPSDVASTTVTQHAAGGAEALSRALDADGPALVVAADCPEGDPADVDHALGAGAAAFVIDDDPMVPISDMTWHNNHVPGVRFRERGERGIEGLDITTYERTAIREAVTEAASALAIDLEDVDAAAVYQPDGGFPYRITADLPVSGEIVAAGTVVDCIGDAGAATVPIGLLAALAEAEDGMTLGVFVGGGTTAALACAGSLSVSGLADLNDGEPVGYATYLRERGYVVDGTVAGGGANVSLPNWRRSLEQRYRLVAGKCPECESVTFPPEGACQNCHDRVEFEPIEASNVGTTRAVTVIGQGGAPPEFAELQQHDGAYAVAIVELKADDEPVMLPAQLTDANPESVAVGDDVRAAVRKVYTQEGVPRYGVKFKPVE